MQGSAEFWRSPLILTVVEEQSNVKVVTVHYIECLLFHIDSLLNVSLKYFPFLIYTLCFSNRFKNTTNTNSLSCYMKYMKVAVANNSACWD